MRKLLIVGAGGHGRVCADIALVSGQWDDVVFVDSGIVDETEAGHKVIDETDDVGGIAGEYDGVFVGIGDLRVRKRIITDLLRMGCHIPALVHPFSCIGSRVTIGQGAVVMPGAVINARATIGVGSIINTSATVDHDCRIGDFVHISPGAHLGGSVSIGDLSWIGIGSAIRNNVSVCGEVMIGAGGVVVCDIENPGTYVGVPAKQVPLQ